MYENEFKKKDFFFKLALCKSCKKQQLRNRKIDSI